MTSRPSCTWSTQAEPLPAYVQKVAPGPHAAHFFADVATTPVDLIFDEVGAGGQKAVRITTFIGDPSKSQSPNCSPFRSRAVIDGMLDDQPIITAPADGYGTGKWEYTFVSSPDDRGESQEAHRSVQAKLAPQFAARVEGDAIRWEPLEGAASYEVRGDVVYAKTCDQVRKLIFGERDVDIGQKLDASATSLPLPRR